MRTGSAPNKETYVQLNLVRLFIYYPKKTHRTRLVTDWGEWESFSGTSKISFSLSLIVRRIRLFNARRPICGTNNYMHTDSINNLQGVWLLSIEFNVKIIKALIPAAFSAVSNIITSHWQVTLAQLWDSCILSTVSTPPLVLLKCMITSGFPVSWSITL